MFRTLSLCACCRHYPPAQRLGALLRSLHPAVSAFPDMAVGSAGLLGVHSRYGLHTRAVTVFRDTLSEGFSHFVASIAAPVASGWSGCRVGFAPTGKRRLFTAHAMSQHSTQYPGARVSLRRRYSLIPTFVTCESDISARRSKMIAPCRMAMSRAAAKACRASSMLPRPSASRHSPRRR